MREELSPNTSTGNKLRKEIAYRLSLLISSWVRKFGVLFPLIIVSVLVALATPTFLRPGNLLNVARQVSINALLAAGQTFVILTGGIDLSVGSILALSSIISANLAVTGMPWGLAIVVGISASSLLGLVNGLAIARANVPAFIATLGMMNIARGITYLWTGAHVVSGLPSSYCVFGKGLIGPVPVPVVIMFIVFIILLFILTKTKFGRRVYAVGGNINAARLSGINTRGCLILVYVICAILSAVGGIVLAGRLSSGQPEAGTGYELDSIAAVVVGGTSFSGGEGTIVGTLVGALTIGVLRNGLDLLDISAFWQQIAVGTVIIVAVYLSNLRKR